MKFGVCVTQVSEVGLAVEAEQQGYDFCWVWDSPMIRSNVWALLALIADKTNRIAVGSGVAVPGLAMAPVVANGIATINAIAPRRTFLGLGTGNTSLRAMGQLPMRISDFERDIRVIRGLLRGESVEFSANDRSEEIAFQSLDLRHINLDDPIPLHVSGFGPRAQALAGQYADALITGIPRGGSIAESLAHARAGAAKVGRELSAFEVYALVNLMLLKPGEQLTSARVLHEVGSSIMVNVHFLYDRFRETAAPPPEYVLPIWDDYVAFRRKRDARRSFTQAHHSHYGHLDAEEARFVTPDVIRQFCIAGHPEEVMQQLHDLEAQGLDGINFVAPADRQHAVCAEFAERVIKPMRAQ